MTRRLRPRAAALAVAATVAATVSLSTVALSAVPASADSPAPARVVARHAASPETTTLVTPATTVPPAPGASGLAASPYQDDVAPTFPAGTRVSAAAGWLRFAIAVRRVRLDALGAVVAGARSLSSGERATLTTLLASDKTAMTNLLTSLEGATSLPAVEAIGASMVLDYRIVAVVTPLVHTTVDLSGQLGRAAAIQAVEPSIEAAITTERPGSKRAARAQRYYAGLVGDVSAVLQLDGGEIAALSPVRATAYRAAATVLATAVADLATGESHLAAARLEERHIVRLLAGGGNPAVRRLR